MLFIPLSRCELFLESYYLLDRKESLFAQMKWAVSDVMCHQIKGPVVSDVVIFA